MRKNHFRHSKHSLLIYSFVIVFFVTSKSWLVEGSCALSFWDSLSYHCKVQFLFFFFFLLHRVIVWQIVYEIHIQYEKYVR